MKLELRTASGGYLDLGRSPPATFNGLSRGHTPEDPTAEARKREAFLRRELAKIDAGTPEALDRLGLTTLQAMWNRANTGHRPSGPARQLFDGFAYVYCRDYE